MKKIKLYELVIHINDELDNHCLFDEGYFYKEWISYRNFADFENQVYNHLNNVKIIEIKGYADQDHLFAKTIDYGYELLPKCYKYYTNSSKGIPSDYALALFADYKIAVKRAKELKKNVELWLNNIRKKI